MNPLFGYAGKIVEVDLSKGKIRLVSCEVLFTPIYQGQPYFWDIARYLHDFGYRFHGLYDEVYHQKNSKLLCWADAIFLSPEMTGL